MTYLPGSLISARGREWIVQPSEPDLPEGTLRLRPLSGTADDEFLLDPNLEPDVRSASFPPPDPEQAGTYVQALHLRNALRLSLRTGAGPFRCFGNLAFSPRAYQLVPLMMALRQKNVRLLIADDVGIGKTIEAGLILRELLDRGEIRRAAVLCPASLVSQWITELAIHFHIQAQAVTSVSAASLERKMTGNESIFDYYPFTVVSLDYIKSDRNAGRFEQTAPEFIIVDEAHSCTQLGGGKQLRWQLVNKLADNSSRHMLFVTATPHSGNQTGFANLLSLLHQQFRELAEPGDHTEQRRELARYFVQRRRADLNEWKDDDAFPKREISEVTYRLDGPWKTFLTDVLAYCRKLLKGHGTTSGRDYVYWYATLGLLRCASSSPAAAELALQNRLTANEESDEAQGENADESRVVDFEEAESSDTAPAVVISANAELKALLQQARDLAERKDDPKLACLIKLLKDELLYGKPGFRPIIFCRFVATANYVAKALQKSFKDYAVTAITGEQDVDARNAALELLVDNPKHILVATDCLAEGLNVQKDFDAVVHYDLLWNPSRHQQREGRVDRFGQHSPTVRCALLYGQDNPIDGMVLKVISRKAKQISDALGVSVSVPADDKRVSLAILQAALFKQEENQPSQQLMLFSEEQLNAGNEALKDLETLQATWEDAANKEKANRTIFAQRSLKPEDVMPEWHKVEGAFGSQDDIRNFVIGSLAEMGVKANEPDKRGTISLPLAGVQPFLQERLRDLGIDIAKPYRVCFDSKGDARAETLTRSHPFVAQLASSVLENALEDTGTQGFFCRCATAVSPDISVITRVFLLRLRHRLEISLRAGAPARTMIVEEASAIAVKGVRNPEWITDVESVEKLLHVIPSSNLTGEAVRFQLDKAMAFIGDNNAVLEDYAAGRARQLLSDHRRVRDAAGATGTYAVIPILPVDIMGAFVLLPEEE